MIPELLQHLLRDTGAVIADGDHQLSVLCGGRHLHVQRVFILPGPVQDGIFHQRLDGQHRIISCPQAETSPTSKEKPGPNRWLCRVRYCRAHCISSASVQMESL